MSFSYPPTPLEWTVYQCSACAYTSPIRHHVVTHSTAVAACRDKGASVLSQRCSCVLGPPGTTPASIHVGNHNSQVGGTNNTINNISVHVHPNLVYVGSEEERDALFRVLKDPANLRELTTLEPEEIAAAVFRMLKGADAPEALKNIRVRGNRVEERRGPDNVVSVPRAKFVRRAVGDLLDTVVKAPPEGPVKTVQDGLLKKDLKLGKARRVCRHEVAQMHAVGSKDVYGLDTEARQFLDDSKKLMDRELDYYAAG